MSVRLESYNIRPIDGALDDYPRVRRAGRGEWYRVEIVLSCRREDARELGERMHRWVEDEYGRAPEPAPAGELPALPAPGEEGRAL